MEEYRKMRIYIFIVWNFNLKLKNQKFKSKHEKKVRTLPLHTLKKIQIYPFLDSFFIKKINSNIKSWMKEWTHER